MRAHHRAWLKAHPNRTVEWLRDRTADGFKVHHIDGDRDNNEPSNLVLIDGDDHNMLHGSYKLAPVPIGTIPKVKRYVRTEAWEDAARWRKLVEAYQR